MRLKVARTKMPFIHTSVFILNSLYNKFTLKGRYLSLKTRTNNMNTFGYIILSKATYSRLHCYDVIGCWEVVRHTLCADYSCGMYCFMADLPLNSTMASSTATC